jgi:hypothetical protein
MDRARRFRRIAWFPLTAALVAVTVPPHALCQNVTPHDGALATIDGSSTRVSDFERTVAASLEKARVTGLAVAILNASSGEPHPGRPGTPSQ